MHFWPISQSNSNKEEEGAFVAAAAALTEIVVATTKNAPGTSNYSVVVGRRRRRENMKGMERPTPVDQNKDRPAESFMLLLNKKKNTYYHSPNPL